MLPMGEVEAGRTGWRVRARVWICNDQPRKIISFGILEESLRQCLSPWILGGAMGSFSDPGTLSFMRRKGRQ